MSILRFLLLCNIFVGGFVVAQQSKHVEGIEIPQILKTDVVVKHLGYTLSYNEKHEQANWVAYQLTKEELNKVASRTNDFMPDLSVKTGTATSEDYKGKGYDRGHLAPAADMSWSSEAMHESFYYSNMSPQVPGFNRGIWKKLEEQIRQWAVDNQFVYVVTGPILRDGLSTIGVNKVSVPAHYYKVILDYSQPSTKAIGFIMPNESSDLSIRRFAVPVDSVEKVTGLDFFPALPNEEETRIEKTLCVDCWTWTATNHSSTPHTKSSSDSMVQCSALTKAGNRCKRMTANKSGRCYQHDDE